MLVLLLGEDTPEIQKYKKWLATQFKTTLINSYQQAVTVISEHQISCLIVDNNLSATNGIKVITGLANNKYLSFPAILLDRTNTPLISAQALKCGATEYLAKEHLTQQGLCKAVIQAQEKHSMFIQTTTTKEGDSFPNVKNREILIDRLTWLISRTTRYKQSFALLLINIDDFKKINEQLGNDAGDVVLKNITTAMNKNIRDSDTLARFNGDEFVIILSDINKKQHIEYCAKKLLKCIAESDTPTQASITLSASMGVAICPTHGETAIRLLNNADHAMQQAKKAGKAQYKFFCDKAPSILSNPEFKRALQKQQFVPYYQPVFNFPAKANSATIVALEALLHLKTNNHTLTPIGKHLYAFEETGLIVPLERWLLNKSLGQLQLWEKQGLHNFELSLNISCKQFYDPAFTTILMEATEHHKCKPSRIVIEVTEQTLFYNITQAIKLLRYLKEQGFKITIDNFGKMYASINYLRNFAIDYVKIDPTFLIDCHYKQSTFNILKGILVICNGLNIKFIAKWVEHEDQLAALQKLGCTTFQGFIFNKPEPTEQVTSLLLSGAHNLQQKRN